MNNTNIELIVDKELSIFSFICVVSVFLWILCYVTWRIKIYVRNRENKNRENFIIKFCICSNIVLMVCLMFLSIDIEIKTGQICMTKFEKIQHDEKEKIENFLESDCTNHNYGKIVFDKISKTNILTNENFNNLKAEIRELYNRKQ